MMRKRSGTTTSDEVRSRHWGGSLARAAFNFFAWVVYRVAYHPPLAKYPRNLGLAARIALAFFGSAARAFPRAAICFVAQSIVASIPSASNSTTRSAAPFDAARAGSFLSVAALAGWASPAATMGASLVLPPPLWADRTIE